MKGLTVQREDAIHLLNSAGLFTKAGVDNDHLAERLTAMPGHFDEEESDLDAKASKLFEEVKDAVEAGIDITVEGSPLKAPKQKVSKMATNGKHHKNGDDEGETPKATRKGKFGRDKGTEEVDEFGFSLGTIPAKVNACISKVGKTMREIKEEAGLTGTAYEHLNKMCKEGHFTKEDGKYKRSEGAPPKKAKAKKKVKA